MLLQGQSQVIITIVIKSGKKIKLLFQKKEIKKIHVDLATCF